LNPKLVFNNHAGYSVATVGGGLLVDPWVAQTAFADGWSLLDGTTSNDQVVALLGQMRGPKTIWYSHEHSDHFSIPFLKTLKQNAPAGVRIAYQRTLDGRVAGHLRNFGFDVNELKPSECMKCADDLSLYVWPFFDTGDSFSLTIACGGTFLNLNDCAIDSVEKCEFVRQCVANHASKIDVLLTQFGYANWIGNESDVALRQAAAREKLERVALQVRVLNPRTVIPFASFVRFCHEENAYMNDAQNTIETLFTSPITEPFRDRLHVMKPGDEWSPADGHETPEARAASAAARAHWKALSEAEPPPLLTQRARFTLDELKTSTDLFRKGISRNLAWANHLAEMLGVIKPVTIRLSDLGDTVRMSYRRGLTPSSDAVAHFTCTSEVLNFIFRNDFGFNTTLVNARFRTNDMAGYSRTWRFFILQDLKKMGLSVSTPWTTLRVVARNIRKFIVRKVS